MTKQTHQKAGESRALLAGVLGGGSPAQIFKASDGSTYPEKKILIQWKPAASLHKRDNQASLNKRDNQASLNKRDNQANLNKRDNQASLHKRDNQASLHKRDNQASLNKRDNQASLNKRDNQATKIILKITHLYIERLMLQEN